MDPIKPVSPWIRPSDQKDRWKESQRKTNNGKKEQQDKNNSNKTNEDNLIGWA